MKKLVLFFGSMLVLSACGTDKTSQTTESSKKEETTSGASQTMKYTALSDLKKEYDVIIVGAGGAGMAAAIQAKENGANPVIFEKMPVAGGNTSKSSAGMNASETKFEKEAGVKDSNDKFYEETLKGGSGTNDKELLRYFVDHSAEAIDWLDSLGIKLSNLTTTGGMSVTRTHRPADGSAVGQYLVKGLERNIYERKIPIFVHAEVVKINEEKGKATGVKVLFNQTEEKTIAAKAVIVTTGGFGANKEMIEKYNPELKEYVSTNSVGSTGDGIQMIEQLGGATVDMEKIQIHPTVEQKNAYLITEAVRGEGAILVNDKGERFVNEMQTRDKVSAAINELPERSAWLVFDSGVKDRVKAVGTYKEKGMVVEGATLKELAEKMGVDESHLTTTLETWNKAVKEKSDQAFSRETAMDNDLSKAPFYAIKIAPGIHHTMGGVKINTKTQVLKKDGSIIPALFAAGEVTGGLHGSNRIGGNAVADIIIFGRQAGNEASSYMKE